MEEFQPHPIPQNVTNFEFHLVGDMTLKQFGYLASGLGSAYLMFILFAQINPYVTYPLIVILSLIGAAFAFLPIQERPLDHWLKAFMNAIFKPTQRKYKSDKLDPKDPNFANRLNLYFLSVSAQKNPPPASPTLATSPTPNLPAEPKKRFNPVQDLIKSDQNLAATPQVPANPSPAASRNPAPISPSQGQDIPTSPLNPSTKGMPTPDELKQTVELAQKAEHIKLEIMQTEQQLAQIKQSASAPGADPKVFASQFQTFLASLQTLNAEAAEISKKLASLTSSPVKTIVAVQQKAPAPTPVKAQVTPTVTLTSTENIINGITTDSLGNYIEGAIIVAHDKQDLPVRALKTNKLGQFIAATPLPNGVYNLTVEKDNLKFDVIQVELKDEVLKPIVISAKPVSRNIA